MSYPIETMRHSAAHVMAAAIQRLFSDARFGVGPAIENGFYYDIDIGRALTPEDLEAIQDEMEKIAKEKLPFERQEMDIDQAIELFEKLKQPFKVELLNDIKTKGTTKLTEEEAGDVDPAMKGKVSVYMTGTFTDLCRGPHVDNSGEIGKFKVNKMAGAYWRGNENNPQLQRVYGLCFATKDELAKYQDMLAEAERRDHRKLGVELDLFTYSPLVGSGLPMFTPRGVILRRTLEDFVWSLMKPYGYERVWIPHLAKTDLYKTSGHLEKFHDDLFYVSSKKTDAQFVLKPMNCPHHTQIFASKPRSYRDLPIRYSEVTTCYRDENTGQLQGLSRVRSLTQDDAHVFCREDQIEKEALAIYDIINKFYAAFNMPLRVRLSTHDPAHMEKYLGGEEVWARSVATLKKLMEDAGRTVEIGLGEAAFYGPKLDFMATDAIGREWQLATLQLDFNLPERFELEYVDADGTRKRPVMLHRAILGSVERFTAIMIEHFAGAFPLWLAPVQVAVLPVADRHAEAAKALAADLAAADIRTETDDSTESVGKKIRNAEMRKVPCMIVFGDKEQEGGELTIRWRGVKEQQTVKLDAFVAEIMEKIASKG